MIASPKRGAVSKSGEAKAKSLSFQVTRLEQAGRSPLREGNTFIIIRACDSDYPD